jgi:hypothetical protein
MRLSLPPVFGWVSSSCIALEEQEGRLFTESRAGDKVNVKVDNVCSLLLWYGMGCKHEIKGQQTVFEASSAAARRKMIDGG